MNKLFIILFICIIGPLHASSTTNDSLIINGNNLYNEANYQLAIIEYQKVIENGFESAELYYNIGNSFFKINDLPSAILFYERAKKLDPSDEDILYNLGLTNSRIIDNHEQVPEIIFKKWWNSFYNRFSVNVWAKIAIFLFIATLFLFAIYLFSKTRFVKKVFFFISLFIFICTAISFTLSMQKYYYSNEHKEAIVFTPTITVKSSPNKNSVDLFVIHEGTKLYITDELESEGWLEIRIANGSVGWLPKSAVVQI